MFFFFFFFFFSKTNQMNAKSTVILVTSNNSNQHGCGPFYLRAGVKRPTESIKVSRDNFPPYHHI